MVVLRIALGIMLMWKGLNFISDTFVIEDVSVLLPALFTLIAGLLITANLFTSIVALIQLPIFLIGTLFIHTGYIERNGFELVLTGIIPFLLLLFITRDDQQPLKTKIK